MQPITRARAFQFVEFGEAGASEAGGSRARPSSCSATRCAKRATSAAIRGISGGGGGQREPRANDQRDFPLEEVPDERMLGSNVNRARDDVLLTRFDAAALVPVLQGRQLLLVHVERASDILQVLASSASSRTCGSCWSAPPKAGRSPTRSAPPACR
jgi:hypothetical protein